MVSPFLLPRVRGQLRLSSASMTQTLSRCAFRQRILSSTMPRRGATTRVSTLLRIGRNPAPEGLGSSSSNIFQGKDSSRYLGRRLFSSASSLRRVVESQPIGDAARSPLEKLAASWESELAAGVLKGKVVTDSQINKTTGQTSNTSSENASENSGKAGEEKGWFTENNDRVVGVWLLGSAGLVFGIVVLGGLTRLTESGLSITEWKPVTGALPPMNKADWEENFAKYKDSPEYRILNPNMNLEEFKFIYYMEWSHRLWGRFIGLSFVLPAAYFIARRRVTKRMAAKLIGIAGLIGFQGFIGWWMVRSGLHDDLFTTPGNEVPRVSQYRLTTHLAAAFTLYLAMLHSGLSILKENALLKKNAPAVSFAELKILKDPRLIPIRRTVLALVVLSFITAMSGGLVAGLDAGLIYNEFPYMGTGVKPPNSELMDPFYARDKDNFKDLWWRNLLENPSTVQFQHRCLAVTTFTAILTFWLLARYGRGGKIWKELLTKKMRAGMTGSVHLVTAQAALGISTLIYMVPTSVAAAHQGGSLALLTGLMVLASRLSIPPYLAEAVVRRMQHEMGTLVGGSGSLSGTSAPRKGITRVASNGRSTTSSPSPSTSIPIANTAEPSRGSPNSRTKFASPPKVRLTPNIRWGRSKGGENAASVEKKIGQIVEQKDPWKVRPKESLRDTSTTTITTTTATKDTSATKKEAQDEAFVTYKPPFTASSSSSSSSPSSPKAPEKPSRMWSQLSQKPWEKQRSSENKGSNGSGSTSSSGSTSGSGNGSSSWKVRGPDVGLGVQMGKGGKPPATKQYY